MAAQFAALLRAFASAEGGAAMTASQSSEMMNMVQMVQSMSGGRGGGQQQQSGMRSTAVSDISGRGGQVIVNDIKSGMNTYFQQVKTNITNPMKGFKMMIENTIKAATNLPGLVTRWGEAMKQSQDDLRRYSGEIASSFGRSRMRDIQRDMKSARRMGGSYEGVTESLDDLKDTIRPYQDEALVVFNNIATAAMDIVNNGIQFLETFKPLVDLGNNAYAILKRLYTFFTWKEWKDSSKDENHNNLFDQMAQGNQKLNKPLYWRRP